MPKFPFPQFLQNHGIRLLFSSIQDTVPGVILEKQKKGYLSIGTLEHLLGGGSQKWATKLQPANIAKGIHEQSFSLAGKTSVDKFGMKVEGGLKHAKSVNFEISEIKARSFLSQSKITIWPAILKIRDTNKPMWKMINNNWVLTLVYYASKMTVKFKVGAGVNLKADIKNRVKISGGAGLAWKSNSSFLITNNQEVPFGFSGWKI